MQWLRGWCVFVQLMALKERTADVVQDVISKAAADQQATAARLSKEHQAAMQRCVCVRVGTFVCRTRALVGFDRLQHFRVGWGPWRLAQSYCVALAAASMLALASRVIVSPGSPRKRRRILWPSGEHWRRPRGR